MNKANIPMFFLLLICMVSMVNADYVFQRVPDTIVITDPLVWYNPTFLYDAGLLTFGNGISNELDDYAEIFFNYTRNSSLTNSVYTFKYLNDYYNVTIPDYCFNATFIEDETEHTMNESMGIMIRSFYDEDTGEKYKRIYCYGYSGGFQEYKLLWYDNESHTLQDTGIFWNFTLPSIPSSESAVMTICVNDLSGPSLTFAIIIFLVIWITSCFFDKKISNTSGIVPYVCFLIAIMFVIYYVMRWNSIC